MYLSLYCNGSKRVIQGLRVRGSWRPNRTEIFWPSLLWPSTFCLSRSPDAQPEALGSILLGAIFLYCILSTSSLDPNLIRAPEGPFGRVWLSLPHLVQLPLQLYCNCRPNCVLTELYNSSTPTRSPTRSLKSHVWSSSSGNNCHAVQRSLSSGASVYESIMGFF